MYIRWLGQGGFLVRDDARTTEILVDPYLSDAVNRNGTCPRQRPVPIEPADIRSDAVICTHDHLDHLDTGAVPDMPADTFFVATYEGCDTLDKLGRTNHRAVREGDAFDVGAIRVRIVYALHTCEAFGVILEADGIRLYISGDTLYDEKLFDIARYKPDITCICINGRMGNMNVQEAVVTAKNIGARLNIPDHYDMFATNMEDPAKFTREFAEDAAFTPEFDREYKVLVENSMISLK